MIKRYGTVITFECDGCGNILGTEETEFYRALEVLEEEGWVKKKQGMDEHWVNFCPDCSDGFEP